MNPSRLAALPMSLRSLIAQPWFAPALIALVAWGAIVSTIDPAGSYPDWPEGPGLTVDEMFNVEQGVYLVEAIRSYGIGLLDPRSIREVFAEPPYLPDHPPLGRLWLGVHHHLARAIAPPVDVDDVGRIESSRPTDSPVNPVDLAEPRPTLPQTVPVTACARTGSATAFAVTIFLVGWYAGRCYGPNYGALAAILLPLTPRLWGHAHLASLETMTNLACTAAVLAIAIGWNNSSPPTGRGSLLAGFALGLALLTKIQAVLLPIPIIAWALWRWRRAAIKPMAVWAVTAGVVFFIGWPWLWLDPVDHLQRYFAHAASRAELSVWYFGARYGDKSVPWTYPWVLFLATLPMATLVLGMRGLLFGVAEEKSSPDVALRGMFAANVIFPLIIFSLPGVSVYDCDRLFLTVFPLWSVLAARGAQFLAAQIPRNRGVACCFAVLLGIQAWNLAVYRPCWLSFYNVLVGGPSGAEKLGLETTYWGDALTRSLLNEVARTVPDGGTVHVAPVLHQFQLDDLTRQSPILRRRRIHLLPYEESGSPSEYLMLYRRRADLPADLREGPQGAELLAEVRRKRVQLAALYRLRR